jgi:O-antigen ligase
VTYSKSNSVWFLILGVAGVTLYVNTNASDPFNTPKLILSLIVSGWLFGHLLDSYRKNPMIFRSQNFLNLFSILFFLGTMLISTLLTDVRITGLIGETQLRNGFLQYEALSIIFLYAARIIDLNYSIRIFKVAILTGVILSAYGLMQVFGNDFIKWDNPYNSMISTVGNPNFAAAILAILASLSLFGLFIKRIPTLYKVISLLVILMSLLAIIRSESRQGLLIVFFSCTFYITLFFLAKYRKTGLLAIPFALFLTLLAILGMLQKGPLANLLYKDSVSVRGYYWRAGIEMWQANPLTGIGIDRYGAFFKEFREATYPLRYGFDLNSTNAHNVVIQLFSTGGIFVGLSYLFLMAVILTSGVRLVMRSTGDDLKVSLSVLSAWIGFQAQSLISIDNIGVSVWGWLLGGAVLGLAQNTSSKNDQGSGIVNNSSNKKLVKINLFQPAVSFITLIPIVILTLSLSRVESNVLVVKSLANPAISENRNRVFDYASKVLTNPLADPSYKLQVSLVMADMGYKEEAFIQIRNLSSGDPRNLDFLRALIFFESQNQNVENLIALRNSVSKYDPWNAQNYLELCKLYKFSGDLVKAKEVQEKIISFAPNSDQAKDAIKELA